MGRLRARELLQVAEYEDLPVDLGQLAQGIFEDMAFLGRDGEAFGRGVGRCEAGGAAEFFERHQIACSAGRAAQATESMTGDREEPRPRTGLDPSIRTTAPGLHERPLENLLGIRLIVHQAPGITMDRLPVPQHEAIESGPISARRESEQVAIRRVWLNGVHRRDRPGFQLVAQLSALQVRIPKIR